VAAARACGDALLALTAGRGPAAELAALGAEPSCARVLAAALPATQVDPSPAEMGASVEDVVS
jgi:hypothetical protein